MADEAIDALSEELLRVGVPVSAEQLHAARPHLGRELLYDTLWSSPLHFVLLGDGTRSLAGHRQQSPGRHAKVIRSRATAEPELMPVVELDGMIVGIEIAALDAVAPFVVACVGRRICLTLNQEHALFRSRDMPFQGDSATAALEVLLIAWALEEVSLPGERLREQIADTRYLLGKRIQEVSRAV